MRPPWAARVEDGACSGVKFRRKDSGSSGDKVSPTFSLPAQTQIEPGAPSPAAGVRHGPDPSRSKLSRTLWLCTYLGLRALASGPAIAPDLAVKALVSYLSATVNALHNRRPHQTKGDRFNCC